MIGLMVLLVLMIGSNAMIKLDKELMPPIEFDMAYVEIFVNDQPAIETERTITTPVERAISAIDGVEQVSSTTLVGRSSILVTFKKGQGDELFKELDSIVKSTTSTMSEVKTVFTRQFGTNQAYEFFMDISGGEMEEMSSFAENVLEPRLEALDEVRDVDLVGILKNEVSIKFDRDEVMKKGLDITQVLGLIQQTNSEETIGELSGEKSSPSLRWNTKLENVEDLKSIMIPTQVGFVQLKDIAKVELQPLDNSSYVWKNGSKDFIFIQIGRVSNVTQLELAEAIRKEIQNIKDEQLVQGFELNEIVTQADYVDDAINGVTDNIIIGAIIAVAIMLLFLRNLRATFIVGLSIPTSILLTFAAMWIFDYSINMLTLIGLGLGVGMMVDSSIVILESIYGKKEQGLSKIDAVIEGIKEVATPVIASMLTTIVVFVPIGLVGGEIGEFVSILSVVVVITLISSVIVSFTVIPALSEKFLVLRKPKRSRSKGSLLNGYRNLVQWIVSKKRYSFLVVVMFFMMFGASLFLTTKIPMTIMPDVFNRYAELKVDFETGVNGEEKSEIVEKMNEVIHSVKDVETNYIIDNGNSVYMLVNMTKGDKITREQKEINEEIISSLRELQESYPIKGVSNPMMGGGGYPVQIQIKGDSFVELKTIAEEFSNQLSEIEGIVGISNSIERTSIEEIIKLRDESIKDAGLSNTNIKQFIELAFLQIPVGEMTINSEKIPMTVEWNENIVSKQQLLDLKVLTPKGEKKLSEFIELQSIDTPNQISHTDGERYVLITADIKGRDLGAINRDVQELLDNYIVPAGYTLSLAGDLEEQQKLMNEMLMVLGIAIFLVYLVMAVQFNHLVHPVVVMSVIPMTIIGVILGLFITQRELNMMSGMGIVMLIGIVLNNAILLIDRTNQLRKEGYGVQDALVEAGKNRIRPIFMTTLTTVGGMMPLAMASGTSGNYQAPMAAVIISGLLFATLITLFLIPAVYRLNASFGVGLSKIGKPKRKSRREKVEKSTNLQSV